MWDLTSEIALFLLGVVITVISLMQEFKGKSRKGYITILILIIVLFIVFGLRKAVVDYKDKKETGEELTGIRNRLENLQRAKSLDSTVRINDSIKNAEFQKKLFDQFGILRDSAKNSPVQYNTTITEARDVYIGDRK